jgi:hypothetical protein
MTQTQDIPTWCTTFQLKLMAALDAIWQTLDATTDPAAIREARDKAKAIGDLAAMARKVAQLTPRDRAKPAETAMLDAVTAGFATTGGLADLSALVADLPPAPTQADHARRALDKLKGGRRGRL